MNNCQNDYCLSYKIYLHGIREERPEFWPLQFPLIMQFCHMISIFHTQQLLLLKVCDSPAQMHGKVVVEVEIIIEYSIMILHR